MKRLSLLLAGIMLTVSLAGCGSAKSAQSTNVADTQTAIDFIMSVKYETNCSKIAINKEAIIEDFLILSKGIAGEILQKFINYKIKFAII